MCGIAGFVDFTKQSSRSHLEKMTDALYHRGPDDAGYALHELPQTQIGLGHRRLSIIDPSPLGAQPMTWQHCTIIFNGEIYNYQEIKITLETLGHTFKGNGDTEVLLHAYDQWGAEMLHHLVGMFAFVIYDSKREEIFFARDRMGVKPMYYYWHNDTLLFASELKSFHQHPGFQKKLDIDGVASFLQYGNVPQGASIFEHTYKLAPGHFMLLNIQTKELKTTSYWKANDWYNQPIKQISFQDAKAITKQKIIEACQYRMVADVPVGIFLSGGYDSTAVAAILQENSTQPLQTFTIGVEDDSLNEAPFAAEIAKKLGTEHHAFTCTIKEALEVIPELPNMYDEPFADSSAIPTFLVSKLAREKVTVALSADGGDELFAGYNRYDYLTKYAKTIGKLPRPIRKTAARTMHLISANRIPYFRNKYNFTNRYEKLKGILKDGSTKNLLLSLSRQYFNDELAQILKVPHHIKDPNYHLSLEAGPSYTDLRQMLATDIQTYLPDDILQKVDRATMASSLEGREPLLDHRLFEWVAQLPDQYKYNKGVKKYLLKEIVYDYIPKEMMERPKMGFAVPVGSWMKNELRSDIDRCFDHDYLEQQGLFHSSKIRQMWNSYLAGKAEYELKIWYLYMFQLWYHRWMMN